MAVGLVTGFLSLPALALLGAALTSAALGSRSSAAAAGLAIGVGAPVAAVTTAMIAAFVLAGLPPLDRDGFEAAGRVLRPASARRCASLRSSRSDRSAGWRSSGGADRASDRAGDAQARTRTSSPRRMIPGVSTSPHTPNIRSLPSTWPR